MWIDKGFIESTVMSSYKNNILTILICCCNAEEYLSECLDSLFHQSIPNMTYKILFINDASSDNSLKIAKSYSSSLKNFTLLNNEKNTGLVKCCNQALSIIDTPYFMRLDADDYLSSDALEKILQEIDSLKKVDFVIFKRWDVLNDRISEIDVDNNIYTWIAAGTIFKTDIVKLVKGYSEQYWEEYDLYLKLLEAGFKYKVSSYRIYYYRRRRESMTSNYKNNRDGFGRLSDKWGFSTLKKYGNFAKILEYYEK